MISPSLKGALLATFSALSLSISMSLTKNLSSEIPTSLVVFLRTFLGILFFLPFLLRKRHQLFKTKRPLLHLTRVATSVCAMLCTYFTYRHLPLGFATSLGMTGSLFTTILSILFLQEKVDKTKWFFLVLGYVGAICILKPHRFALEWGILTALLANLLAGSSLILAKILSKEESTLTIMGYTNVGTFVASSLLNINGWQRVALNDLGLLLLIALLGLCSQYSSLTALRSSTPSFLAPFEYTRLVFSFMIGFLFFQEIPDIYVFLGSIIIVTATYCIVYRENKKTRFNT